MVFCVLHSFLSPLNVLNSTLRRHNEQLINTLLLTLIPLLSSVFLSVIFLRLGDLDPATYKTPTDSFSSEIPQNYPCSHQHHYSERTQYTRTNIDPLTLPILSPDFHLPTRFYLHTHSHTHAHLYLEAYLYPHKNSQPRFETRGLQQQHLGNFYPSTCLSKSDPILTFIAHFSSLKGHNSDHHRLPEYSIKRSMAPTSPLKLKLNPITTPELAPPKRVRASSEAPANTTPGLSNSERLKKASSNPLKRKRNPITTPELALPKRARLSTEESASTSSVLPKIDNQLFPLGINVQNLLLGASAVLHAGRWKHHKKDEIYNSGNCVQIKSAPRSRDITYRLTFGIDPSFSFIACISPPNPMDAGLMANEVAIMRACGTLPDFSISQVPKIFYYDPSKFSVGGPWFLMEEIHGLRGDKVEQTFSVKQTEDALVQRAEVTVKLEKYRFKRIGGLRIIPDNGSIKFQTTPLPSLQRWDSDAVRGPFNTMGQCLHAIITNEKSKEESKENDERNEKLERIRDLLGDCFEKFQIDEQCPAIFLGTGYGVFHRLNSQNLIWEMKDDKPILTGVINWKHAFIAPRFFVYHAIRYSYLPYSVSGMTLERMSGQEIFQWELKNFLDVSSNPALDRAFDDAFSDKLYFLRSFLWTFDYGSVLEKKAMSMKQLDRQIDSLMRALN